ncbi:MAG: hypothetical protein H0V09_02130 [Gemmatimonadetes bacterium]|nr:hypothetical protein [Gemmatimonadota bacterium]
MAASDHHNVYVVLLGPGVLRERRFRAANPQHVRGQPCVYVGVTGLTPEERLQRHKAGVQACGYVTRYGKRLMPELYEFLNPMPYASAAEMEGDLAQDLRELGYGVWQN